MSHVTHIRLMRHRPTHVHSFPMSHRVTMSPMLNFVALRYTSFLREDVDGTVVLFPAPGAAPATDLAFAPRRIVVLDGG